MGSCLCVILVHASEPRRDGSFGQYLFSCSLISLPTSERRELLLSAPIAAFADRIRSRHLRSSRDSQRPPLLSLHPAAVQQSPLVRILHCLLYRRVLLHAPGQYRRAASYGWGCEEARECTVGGYYCDSGAYSIGGECQYVSTSFSSNNAHFFLSLLLRMD